MLYSDSLEKHLSAYEKEIKQQYLNEQYQLAQSQVIRESEMMDLSVGQTMLRLQELQKKIAADFAATKEMAPIPLSKTNAPEIFTKQELSEISQMSKEENLLPIIKQINEMKDMANEDLLPVVKELKAYREKRKQIEEGYRMTNEDLLPVIKELKAYREKRKQVEEGYRMANEEPRSSIKPSSKRIILRPSKTPSKYSFERELEKKVEQREQRLTPSEAPSEAPTESTSTTAQASFEKREEPKAPHLMTQKTDLIRRLNEAGIEVPKALKGRGTVAQPVLNEIETRYFSKEALSGNGLKRKLKRKK